MEYPFSALVGQEPLKTALLLNAVYPGIGGVLVRGEKGTAKSTAARALRALLPPLHVVEGCPSRCDPDSPWPECPHCGPLAERRPAEAPVPFIDLPLGATEDRVLGTLDFERALREGRRAFEPGLLAAAHRGILYIDEVNLLPDHLVDVLLDAAALGVNTVQREGISASHPARFLLIGTMNREEGDLRPQLLDRFGLMVEVVGPRDPAERAEVVRRRLAFEADPSAFAARWESEQVALRRRVVTARDRLPRVALDDALLAVISRLCCEFEVDGLRADIVMHKAARALAALEGRDEATTDDVRRAAELVLPHRRRRRPFEQPHLERERLDEALTRAQETAGSEQVFDPAPAPPVPRVEVAPPAGASPSLPHGRRNPTPTRERGHYVRAVPDEKPTDLAIDATLRAAVLRGGQAEGRPVIEACDLRRKERAGKTGTLVLFVVDASGSMAARRRMELVKGAVLGLLQSAYEQRDEVGVIAFRGPQAEVLLEPTGSVGLAEQALRALPTGGRTPLAHALVSAGEVLGHSRRSRPDVPALLVLLSDGKANVP
ncbi:MAG TPA: magnesium chelatase subunit D family protein, partial [Gemmataceae bacterium]|nr:magnesium chelatase subunit D family protein [Gemmataceae bacterium]